jgi:hypothetical protein
MKEQGRAEIVIILSVLSIFNATKVISSPKLIAPITARPFKAKVVNQSRQGFLAE